MKFLNVLFLASVLSCPYSFAQNNDSSLIDFRTVLKSGLGNCISTSQVKISSPIKGSFFFVGNGDGEDFGTLDDRHFNFLDIYSLDIPKKYMEDQAYIKKLINNKNENIDSLVQKKPDIGKIFSYYIVPEYINLSKDSIALFFKYSFDSLMSNNNYPDYKYDIKLFYKFVIVPLNKINTFSFINEHLGNKEAYFIFSRTDSTKEKLYSRFTTSHFDEINNSVDESKIKNLKFGLSAEFIRSNSLNDNIIARKLDFPMEGANILRGDVFNVPVELHGTIYRTSFLIQDSIGVNKEIGNIHYDLFFVPIYYKDNELTFDILISCTKDLGGSFFEILPIKKRITIKRGEEIKLNIPPGLFDKLMKKNLKPNEFAQYKSISNVNESFVIGFDSVYDIR